MEKELNPVSFRVLEIVKGERPDIVGVKVEFFNTPGKEYSYYRKQGTDGIGFGFVVIDGCRVTFKKYSLELMGITREYNTKGGRRKTSTENQVGKGTGKRTKYKVTKNLPSWVEIEEDAKEWQEVSSEKVNKLLNQEQNEQKIWSYVEDDEDEEQVEVKEIPKSVKHERYNDIFTCIKCGIPVYLAGPAGSGKNYTVEQIAKELGWNFYFSNSVQQEYKLTGFIDAGGDYHETEFYKACTDGDDCVFFLDEVDASIPEVLVLLNAAIANGYFEFPNGRVDFDKVHFVAAGNTVGTGADEIYTGRMVIDQATLDRFAIIDFGYDENIEYMLTKGNSDLINFIHELRDIAETKGIRATFSYRCMIMASLLEEGGMEIEKIVKIAIMKGLDKDTLNTFVTDYSKNTKYHLGLRNLQATF